MKKMKFSRPSILICCFFAAYPAIGFGQVQKDSEWPAYGNDPGGMRYAAAAQINRGNVANLKVAWTYRTGANDLQGPHHRERQEAEHHGPEPCHAPPVRLGGAGDHGRRRIRRGHARARRRAGRGREVPGSNLCTRAACQVGLNTT